MFDVSLWEVIVRDLTSGKGQFRLILQPLMAVILGVRVGIADAKHGHQPFFARLTTTRERWPVLKSSILSAALPLTLALVIDAILQYLTLGFIRPLAAVVVGILLVWLPFSMVRGLTNRIWHRTRHPKPAGA